MPNILPPPVELYSIVKVLLVVLVVSVILLPAANVSVLAILLAEIVFCPLTAIEENALIPVKL